MTNQSSAGNIFLGVLAIATIRDFLEVALEGRILISIEHPLNSLKTYFLHFNSFYFLVFVSLSLVLYLFALKRMRITECFTIGAMAMAIIWVGPVFDYIYSGTFDMFYPSDPLDLLCNLHHFADPGYEYDGMSKGMRFEIMLAGMGGIGLLYYKTRKIITSVCGGICISFTCLAIGLLIPVITQIYEYGLNLGYHELSKSVLLHQGYVVHGTGSKIALFYILLCLILFSVAYYLRSRQRFIAIVKNMRWTRTAHYLLLFLAGLIFIYHNPPVPEAERASYIDYLATIWNHPTDILGIFMAAVSIFLSFQSAVIFNDIYDYDIDAVSNADRPLTSNAISLTEYRFIAKLFAVVALAISFCISETFFLFVLLYNLLAFLYSAPPFRLRKYFLISNLELAAIFVLTFHAGTTVLISDYSFESIPPYITIGLLICYALALAVKDVKDQEGDKAAQVQTLYTLFGKNVGNIITTVFVCAAILMAPLMLHLRQLFAFSLIVCILFLMIVYLVRGPWKERLVVALYFIYVLATFCFLASAH